LDTETLIWRIVTNILANIKIRVRGHLASMNCERSHWENEKTEASGVEEILAKIALLQILEAESNSGLNLDQTLTPKCSAFKIYASS